MSDYELEKKPENEALNELGAGLRELINKLQEFCELVEEEKESKND